MNILATLAAGLCLTGMSAFTDGTQPTDSIISTPAWTWTRDAVIQKEFKAQAIDPYTIQSNYHAQPHYYMPIGNQWKKKNDLSAYPQLSSSYLLHNAVYNMGLDEMVNAVEPDTTLRTGAAWGGVWTRDVSYSIIPSLAYLQPLASEVSLRRKVNANGRIIQDTGSGGAWPVSSDRQIWTVAAFELYKATGSQQWLEFAYEVAKNSMMDDFKVVSSENGVVLGETSFIDWREQSYPRWMQTADIYSSEALSTSIVHCVALKSLSKMASLLGRSDESAMFAGCAETLSARINEVFWMQDKGYYGMYTYGRNHKILNPRAETLGESLAILYGIASDDRAKTITENNPITPYGSAIFYPQIADMPSYHNNALWPWVGSYWAMANARAGNEEGTLMAIGAVVRPAALFCTNKENFNLDNGDIATQLNSSNMLWCLAGNLAITYRILFGMDFDVDEVSFHPFVPKALADTRTLTGFKWRDLTLDITVKGWGSKIKSFKINGKKAAPRVASSLKAGKYDIVIEMDCKEIEPLKVNFATNKKAPLTPIAWLEEEFLVRWNPVEYSDHYLVLCNGQPVMETHQTSFATSVRGEYQVIAVDPDGTESFASQPVSNLLKWYFELPGEGTAMGSEEICYAPTGEIDGWYGDGFVEIDHLNGGFSLTIEVPEDGDYALSLIYSNGNGPVNTENKCCVRTVLVDGNRLGAVVMPQRGEFKWEDWGESSILKTFLKAGEHTLEVKFLPENENMNLRTNHALVDRVKVVKL